MQQLPFPVPEGDLIAYVDGGSRGNPGESGFGVVLKKPSGEVLHRVRGYLGEGTNNTAEYRALIAGLESAIELGCQRLEVRSDSQLMVRQIKGIYKVTRPHLRALLAEAQTLIVRFRFFAIAHIPRKENQEADRLANEAIEEKAPWP